MVILLDRFPLLAILGARALGNICIGGALISSIDRDGFCWEADGGRGAVSGGGGADGADGAAPGGRGGGGGADDMGLGGGAAGADGEREVPLL